jgi:DNA-binding phage protein
MNTNHMSSLVREMFETIKRRGRTVASVSRDAGVDAAAVRNWNNANPQLHNFVAMVNALGGEVVIRWGEPSHGESPAQTALKALRKAEAPRAFCDD